MTVPTGTRTRWSYDWALVNLAEAHRQARLAKRQMRDREALVWQARYARALRRANRLAAELGVFPLEPDRRITPTAIGWVGDLGLLVRASEEGEPYVPEGTLGVVVEVFYDDPDEIWATAVWRVYFPALRATAVVLRGSLDDEETSAKATG